jgi:nucleotide-binding universal stress UspA family protein
VLVVKASPRGPYERVLIAVDYSPPSRLALRQALRLAPGAEAHVLHVFEPWALEIMQRTGTDPEKIAVARNDLLNEEFDRLQEFLSGACTEGQNFHTMVIDDPHPGNRINQYAETIGADLVAIGCIGASNLRSILLGSVAEHVLRESTCDVLAVREGKADFELP